MSNAQRKSKAPAPQMTRSPKSNPSKDLAIIILAAGKGTRMKSNMAKVLHKIAGKPMINHIIETAESLKPSKIITVIGEHMDDVADAASPHQVAIQKQQKGTADAVKSALTVLDDFKGQVLVLYGDAPLVTKQTLEGLVGHHRQGGFGATVSQWRPPTRQDTGASFKTRTEP